MSGNDVTLDVGRGQAEIRFPGKPSATIRKALKANRYRWSPSGGYWWKRGVSGAADFVGALRLMLDREAGIRRVDGPCRKCGHSAGYVRSHGASTFVLCDACEAKEADEQHRVRYGADAHDMRMEDDMARQCGIL